MKETISRCVMLILLVMVIYLIYNLCLKVSISHYRSHPLDPSPDVLTIDFSGLGAQNYYF